MFAPKIASQHWGRLNNASLWLNHQPNYRSVTKEKLLIGLQLRSKSWSKILSRVQLVIWKRWRQFQFCCLFWYRHRLPKSLRNLLLIGQMSHALKTKWNTNPERICHPMIHADLAYAGLEENIVPNQIVKDLKSLILQCNQKMSFEIEIFCWFSNTVSGLNYRCHTSSSWHEVRTLSFRSGWHQKYFAILGHDAIYCCEIILH